MSNQVIEMVKGPLITTMGVGNFDAHGASFPSNPLVKFITCHNKHLSVKENVINDGSGKKYPIAYEDFLTIR